MPTPMPMPTPTPTPMPTPAPAPAPTPASTPTSKSIAEDFLKDSALNDGFDKITPPSDAASQNLREVQNAIRAARESAKSALRMASVINRVLKTADGKSLVGRWTPQAVDSLRSALLFASAGLDVSLKSLVQHALPSLPDRDSLVEERFQKWAEINMRNGQTGIDAKALLRVLMTKGNSPRDSLMSSWVYDLTSGSAQSAERVVELTQALGVVDSAIRKRVTPSKSSTATKLQSAFAARNLIAHELDVTQPGAETRKALESIRKHRAHDDIAAWCVELLDVTQVITNDVARRRFP